MFRLSRYFQKHLKGYIDFETFVLIAVIPRKKKNAVILLAPRYIQPYSYFVLQSGKEFTHHSDINTLLTAARKYYGINKFKLWRCRKRYEHFKRSGRI